MLQVIIASGFQISADADAVANQEGNAIASAIAASVVVY